MKDMGYTYFICPVQTDLMNDMGYIYYFISPAQTDLMKDMGYTYFIKYLEANDSSISGNSRAEAAFVLAVVCDANVRGQGLCMRAGLVGVLCTRLMGAAIALDQGQDLLLTRGIQNRRATLVFDPRHLICDRKSPQHRIRQPGTLRRWDHHRSGRATGIRNERCGEQSDGDGAKS
jgi:hypothetical protein